MRRYRKVTAFRGSSERRTRKENCMTAQFPTKSRLKKSFEFQRVYQRAKRSGDEWLLVFAIVNELEYSRLGLSVSRKYGVSVRRNRVKRVLREAFRLSTDQIPRGLDLIVIPRGGIEPVLEPIRKSLIRSTRILAGKLRLPDMRPKEKGE